ncbi:MAG: radical SAM protein [bacterium]
MRYHGNVIRPPSEASSLILQVMYGCSHGDCAFCGSYLGKPFRVRPFVEVEQDVKQLPPAFKVQIRRVFLCDGDALAVPANRLRAILDLLTQELPNLTRVSAYANAHSLLRLSDEDLLRIRAHGLELLYFGLESGDEHTIGRIGKGVTVRQQIDACRKATNAGFALSVTAILGLAGVARSLEHAQATGGAISAIDPGYIGLLTLMVEPGTPLNEMVGRGEFVLPAPVALLRELREMVAATNVTNAIFRSNHASNYLPLKATLPADKDAILRTLDGILKAPDQVRLKPESLRAL